MASYDHSRSRRSGIAGVAEAVVIPEDEVAYLKVDKKALDREALLHYSIDH